MSVNTSWANPPGLAILQDRLQQTQLTINGTVRVANTLITQFLQTPSSETNWNNMNTGIIQFMSAYSPLLNGLRVLISLSDGTVAYATSRGALNTFADYQSKSINENHNTRVAVMTALLGNSGTGFETKQSTSTGYPSAYSVLRMGMASSVSLGCVVVSAYTVV